MAITDCKIKMGDYAAALTGYRKYASFLRIMIVFVGIGVLASSALQIEFLKKSSDVAQPAFDFLGINDDDVKMLYDLMYNAFAIVYIMYLLILSIRPSVQNLSYAGLVGIAIFLVNICMISYTLKVKNTGLIAIGSTVGLCVATILINIDGALRKTATPQAFRVLFDEDKVETAPQRDR